MIIIIGLVILVAAVVVGIVGVLFNDGGGHALTHPFAVFGYHATGSAGELFLYGIVVGIVALAGLSLRTEGRADQAKGDIKQAGAKIKDASGY
jgi:amino acid transporter